MTKILLVEDDIFLVKVYEFKLRKEGYEVLFLQDGSKVSKVAIEFNPDIIILDILMPIKDGFEVLSELKNDPQTTKIPVLMLSALQMEKDIERGKALGAAEYLPKTNVTFEQVISSIKKLTN